MKNTDKLYEIDRNTVFKTQSRIMEAISECSEKHHLCMEDINALARFLVYGLDTGNIGRYEAIADFLWMSFRIELNHKMLLLDLANDLLTGGGLSDHETDCTDERPCFC